MKGKKIIFFPLSNAKTYKKKRKKKETYPDVKIVVKYLNFKIF